MSFTPFDLTKSWENPSDFPTFEAEESKVRSDMQSLFTELANGLKLLLTELQAYGAAGGAESIGIKSIDGMTGVETIQAALEQLEDQVVNKSIDSIPDHTISNAMLSRKGQTPADPGGGPAVDTDNIADDAITADELADGAVGTAALAAGAVTAPKCDFSSHDNMQIGSAVLFTSAGTIVLNELIYGENFPAASTAGRLFFKKA